MRYRRRTARLTRIDAPDLAALGGQRMATVAPMKDIQFIPCGGPNGGAVTPPCEERAGHQHRRWRGRDRRPCSTSVWRPQPDTWRSAHARRPTPAGRQRAGGAFPERGRGVTRARRSTKPSRGPATASATRSFWTSRCDPSSAGLGLICSASPSLEMPPRTRVFRPGVAASIASHSH
jgi:hypothetical protein